MYDFQTYHYTCGPETLNMITSRLGKPLFPDECTAQHKRGTYTRVLVDINMTQKLIEEIEIVENR